MLGTTLRCNDAEMLKSCKGRLNIAYQRFLKLPVPYDFCIRGPILCLLTVGKRIFCNRVLNVKALVASFNQEKALVGAFSMIVQLRRLIVNSTNLVSGSPAPAPGHWGFLLREEN